MKGNATYNMLSVKAIPMTYKQLFRRDLDLYDAIAYAQMAVRKTGNLTLKDKGVILEVSNYMIAVPCDIHRILAIANPTPLNNYSYGRDVASGNIFLQNGALFNETSPTSPESVVTPSNPSFPVGVSYLIDDANNYVRNYRGSLIDFVWEGNYLKFNNTGMRVEIIYQGVYTDCDGIFMIQESDLLAICYYINYIDLSARFYNGEGVNPNAIAMAKEEMSKHFGQSSIGDGFTANEMDKIFNTLTSHNRKKFNVQLMNL